MAKSRLLRRLFRSSPLYRTSLYYRISSAYHWYLERDALARWNAAGRSGAPPHSVKRATVRALAREHHLKTLVETGTALGEMVFAMRRDFETIYSIELEPTMHENAKRRLRGEGNVSLLLGDSAQVLPTLVAKLREPALFWLDGHYSGERTGRGSLDTPIRDELKTILTDRCDKHVILVDDAHCFTGEGDYPTLAEIETLAKSLRPEVTVSVADNMIRIA